MVKTRKAPRLLPKNVFFDFLLYHFYRMYTLQPQKLPHPVVKKQIIRERERVFFYIILFAHHRKTGSRRRRGSGEAEADEGHARATERRRRDREGMMI